MLGVARILSRGPLQSLKIIPGAFCINYGRTQCLLDSVTRSLSDRGFDDKHIEDFNAELEFVFGGRPKNLPHLQDEDSKDIMRRPAQEPASHVCHETANDVNVSALSHVDAAGKASMVNVVDKIDVPRVAVASGKVFIGLAAFNLVAANRMAKGDVLTVAKIAGIQGAKLTSSLIPLCHNIFLSGVDVTLSLDESHHAIDIRAKATTTGKTGVEMEALTAVSIAGLTVYDMCKAVSKGIRISNVQLESKTGGKSGDWFRR